jgi:hypothetical protein
MKSDACEPDSDARVGTVLINEKGVQFVHNPGSRAKRFQLYAGPCEGSDYGGHLVDETCDTGDVKKYARSPESYPLMAQLLSSVATFSFTEDNQVGYLKSYPFGEFDYETFRIGSDNRRYISLHADVCTEG